MSRQVVASIALTVILVAVAITGCTTASQLSESSLLAGPRPTTLAPTTQPPPKRTHPAPAIRPPADRPTTAITKAPGVEVWQLAPGGTGLVGSGAKTLFRYRVEVEQATNVDAAAFAAVVEETLADPRGWTVGGWRFQRVTLSRREVNLVVLLATPATTDKLCFRYGRLYTGGVVSCRAGNFVIINLTRWTTGVTAYAGDVVGYRHLVLNHEIGHRLGQRHAPCPGAGMPQPVMMQVYYTGLQGCVKNPWPYAEDGTLIG